jgi:hypothetical protein
MRIRLTLLLALSVLACSNPYSTVIPSDVSKLENDTKFKEVVQKLPEKDRELLAGYLMRSMMGKAFGGGGAPEGTTVRQAIDAQKTWIEQKAKEEAEAKALAAKVQAQKEAKARELNAALTVAVTGLRYVPSNWQARVYENSIAVGMAFENKTDRTISGAKGTLVISDMFDSVIKSVNVSYDQGVKAKETASWVGQLSYNQFVEADKKLASTPFEKLKFKWEPQLYVFEDGTKLSALE